MLPLLQGLPRVHLEVAVAAGNVSVLYSLRTVDCEVMLHGVFTCPDSLQDDDDIVAVLIMDYAVELVRAVDPIVMCVVACQDHCH